MSFVPAMLRGSKTQLVAEGANTAEPEQALAARAMLVCPTFANAGG